MAKLKLLIISIVILLSGCSNKNSRYGVFLGANSLGDINGYEEVVIDAQGFNSDEIKKLKDKGIKVYSYLNIGSIETYRDYYEEYSKYNLKPYENWSDEYWIDVTEKDWQKFISIEMANSLVLKNIDGFFIDNADVYYHYPNSEVYEGLKIILKNLNKYNLPIIINGGDTFVSTLIENSEVNLIDGINQEGVFSKIDDYENDVFSDNDLLNRDYYISYLEKCKLSGLEIYLIEYTKSKTLEDTVNKFCSKNSYSCYISKTVNLD